MVLFDMNLPVINKYDKILGQLLHCLEEKVIESELTFKVLTDIFVPINDTMDRMYGSMQLSLYNADRISEFVFRPNYTSPISEIRWANDLHEG